MSTDARPTCRCGYDRDNFWVSAEPQYTGFVFYMGLFFGLRLGNPKRVRFKCRKCGEVVETSRDPDVIAASRNAYN